MARALGLVLGFVLALPVAGTAVAQDGETLADIRQDLTVLNVEIQRLKRELSTTQGVSVPSGGTLLDRVSLIESELTRLTAKTEELEFRITRIVEDGTNRIGDLEFRLVELEGGDVSQLAETSTLGGTASLPVPTPQPETPATGEVAVGERADFEAAQALLDAGSAAEAAEAFLRFTETYPGGPFQVAALMGRGDALAAMGDTREASRTYLAAYNAAPQAPSAPAALLKLGDGLNALGQMDAACQILAQLTATFPTAQEVGDATARAQTIGCP